MSKVTYTYEPRHHDDRQPTWAAIVVLPLAIVVGLAILSTMHSVGETIMSILEGWT